MVRSLVRNYSSADVFKSTAYKKFINIPDDCGNEGVKSKLAMNDVVNTFVQEVSSLYVIRNDQEFRNLFELDDHNSL